MSKLSRLIMVFLISFLISTVSLYACGGENGGSDDALAALLGNQKAQEGLGWHFGPIPQNNISGDTLDINDIDHLSNEELGKLIKDDIKNDMWWSDFWSNVYRGIGNISDAGEKTSKVVVVAAAVTTAVLAANPEVLAGLGGLFSSAEALSAPEQILWGASYSGVTSSVTEAFSSFWKGKSLKQIMKNSTKSGIKSAVQSAILGKLMPTNPVIENLTDAALAEYAHPGEISKSPVHFDGLTDYGPGYATTQTGQKMMK